MHIVHLKKFLSNDNSTREVQNFSIASQLLEAIHSQIRL